MKKKMIAVMAAAAMMVTACGSSGGTQTAETSTLNKVLESGKLRVAILPDNPGWSTLGTDNDHHGIDADIARLLAESLGVELEFQNTDGAGRVPMIQSDKADVVIACLTATNERAKSVAFTDPYASGGIIGLCKSDHVLQSWDDLEGKKISVARGSINDTFATDNFKTAEIVRFDAIADAFTALRAGKVDVLLEDVTTVNDLAASNDDVDVMPVNTQQSSYMCMAVKQGDAAWMEYLNNFIRNALYDGQINEFYKDAFKRDMPKLMTY